MVYFLLISYLKEFGIIQVFVWQIVLNLFRSASPKNGAVTVTMTAGTSRMRRTQSAATFRATPKPGSAARTTGVSPGGACVTRWTTVEMDQMKTIWIYVRNGALFNHILALLLNVPKFVAMSHFITSQLQKEVIINKVYVFFFLQYLVIDAYMVNQFQVVKNSAIVMLHSLSVLINGASMRPVYVTVWTIVETTQMNSAVVSEQYFFLL